jgi:hypothetical protein
MPATTEIMNSTIIPTTKIFFVEDFIFEVTEVSLKSLFHNWI